MPGIPAQLKYVQVISIGFSSNNFIYYKTKNIPGNVKP